MKPSDPFLIWRHLGGRRSGQRQYLNEQGDWCNSVRLAAVFQSRDAGYAFAQNHGHVYGSKQFGGESYHAGRARAFGWSPISRTPRMYAIPKGVYRLIGKPCELELVPVVREVLA